MPQTVKVLTLLAKGEDPAKAMARARINACEQFHLHCVSDIRKPVLGPITVDGKPGDPTGDMVMETEWTIG